jgi:hypothetical protein
MNAVQWFAFVILPIAVGAAGGVYEWLASRADRAFLARHDLLKP